MERIIIVLVCLFAGAAGSYFYFDNSTTTDAEVIIGAPSYQKFLRTATVPTSLTIIAVHERDNGNNAVAMVKAEAKTLIGVDFSNFDWTRLSGVGTSINSSHLEGDAKIQIKGILPDLKVDLHLEDPHTSEVKILSYTRHIKEEKLREFAEEKKRALTDCIQDRALYQKDILEDAKNTVIAMLSAVIPSKPNGESLVEFDLSFGNETEFLERARQFADGEVAECSAGIFKYDES
ncbi:hypothetical protein [Celeribacter litoreus]|uniref:hypothetical protein n=1 Tax=Celeribacter litoreus TaxID=2876714 RepID=UPI001CC949FB|nr:hypothetical protein [Celeribacter litoreus]MCA0043577.1 hypothetical protein [Celeribacter litoreus]